MDHNGKIITVSSVKGGVGKTTLTLNLAGLYFLMKKKVYFDSDYSIFQSLNEGD